MINTDFGVEFGEFYSRLKKPVEDLTNEFKKLRRDKKFSKKRLLFQKLYRNTYLISKTRKFNKSTWLQIWAKVVSEANGGAHKIYNATVHALICKTMGKNI